MSPITTRDRTDSPIAPSPAVAPSPVAGAAAAAAAEAAVPAAPAPSAPTADAPIAVDRVVPLRHWARWIASAVAVFLLTQLLWTFFTNPQWRWNVFAEYFFNPAVLRGLWLTLWLTAVSAVIGFVLGAVLALARLSGSALLNSFAWG